MLLSLTMLSEEVSTRLGSALSTVTASSSNCSSLLLLEICDSSAVRLLSVAAVTMMFSQALMLSSYIKLPRISSILSSTLRSVLLLMITAPMLSVSESPELKSGSVSTEDCLGRGWVRGAIRMRAM